MPRPPSTATPAAAWKTARIPQALAMAGRTSRARLMPTGHALIKMVMAQMISPPTNQSVTILVRSTLRRIAPTAVIRRPSTMVA